MYQIGVPMPLQWTSRFVRISHFRQLQWTGLLMVAANIWQWQILHLHTCNLQR
jgi:hypothetical protein